jgi:FKBP-type peptidyl-prolyl cis-trans isomerase SlyD
MRVQIVSFRCVLKNILGQTLSSSFNQDVVTTPSENEEEMLPELASALRALKNGQKKKIFIPAEKAYGFYDPNLVMDVPRKKLKNGASLKEGDTVTGMMEQDGKTRTYRVASGNSISVTLDANHPFAGQDLIFDVEMLSKQYTQAA